MNEMFSFAFPARLVQPSLAKTESKNLRWSATCRANCSSLAVARTINRPFPCSARRYSRRTSSYGRSATSSLTRRAISRFRSARPRPSQNGRANKESGACRNRLTSDSTNTSVLMRVPSRSTTSGTGVSGSGDVVLGGSEVRLGALTFIAQHSRMINNTLGAPSFARNGLGHAGDETSNVRPLTPIKAVPGLYSLGAILHSPLNPQYR